MLHGYTEYTDSDVLSLKYSEPVMPTYIYSNIYWGFFEIRTTSVKLI